MIAQQEKQETEWLTAAQVADLWTRMATERGFVRDYTPSAVARTITKRRDEFEVLPIAHDGRGRPRLHLVSEESARRVGQTLRPWSGHPPAVDDSPLTEWHCNRCHRALTEYEAQNMHEEIRTWTWCQTCKREDNEGWRQHYRHMWLKGKQASRKKKRR